MGDHRAKSPCAQFQILIGQNRNTTVNSGLLMIPNGSAASAALQHQSWLAVSMSLPEKCSAPGVIP
ncbi:DEAD/DEAH box helicase [Apiospora arundinis]